MFLKKLSDKEAVAFLSLAEKLVLTDEEIDQFEASIMEGFKSEMNVTSEPEKLPWAEAIEVFNTSSNTIKRAVVVELLSACFVNNDFDQKQVELVSEVQASFGIPKEFIDEASAWVRNIMELTEKGFNLVEGM